VLTEREFYILLSRHQGMTQTQIARELHITQGVVSRAETNARQKVLDAQVDLARLARLGVTITPEEKRDDDLLERARRRTP
jgi:transcriptional regulator